MAKYIIEPGQTNAQTHFSEPFLKVSELFTDTFQGEGLYAGTPSIFLRLAGCHLGCQWCDSKEIWNKSTFITVKDLVDLFVREGLVKKLNQGFHLVITGGAPLLQQTALTDFLINLQSESKKSKIFVEIENEATVEVEPNNNMLFWLIDCWNNSPKLETSGVSEHKRYKPEALLQLKQRTLEVWYKFVIVDEKKDWAEINEKFLKPGLISKKQIMLMPEGQTQEELSVEKKRKVAEMAVKYGVRYSPRLQIDIYNDRKGV